MGVVYMVKNKVNNKLYIGKSKRPVHIRWAEHIRYARSGSHDTALCRAIRKYGEDNFSFCVIENNIPDVLLSKKEQEYIKQYNTFHDGYNETFGGEGESSVDAEQMVKLYTSGKNYSEIADVTKHTRKTVSATLRSLGYMPKSISGNNRGKGKQVQFQGRTFRSITRLAEYLKSADARLSDRKISTIITGVNKVLCGTNKHYYGYTFSYL